MALADRIRNDAPKFVRAEDFAEAVSLTISGVTTSINCLFYEDYKEHGPFDSGIADGATAVLCRSADVEGISNDDTIVRGGVTYYVTNAKPDSHGHRVLILSKRKSHG